MVKKGVGIVRFYITISFHIQYTAAIVLEFLFEKLFISSSQLHSKVTDSADWRTTSLLSVILVWLLKRGI